MFSITEAAPLMCMRNCLNRHRHVLFKTAHDSCPERRKYHSGVHSLLALVEELVAETFFKADGAL
jgi:hypothetical protein